MNALIVVGAAIVLFFLGYRFYAERVGRLLDIEPSRKTPAHTQYDGVDYVPAQHWTILFGHHFASIAGAAPIVGPILAVSIWGWGPTLVWIILGTIFIGGIHDFCSLIISVRHGGSTVADIAEETISKNAKIVFLSFVWLTLILIISVFVYISAKTLVVKPEIVVPSLGLIPVAIIVGILLYNVKMNQVAVTVLGLLALAGLMVVGSRFPIIIPGNGIVVWSVVLLVYSFVASITPVQILLQPRDYLSAFLLVFGLLGGYLGIVLTRPSIQYPAFTGWRFEEGGLLWPVLFVTVACGAISGFHSLVASGTTSKQLANEAHAKRIGYGGMVAEGLLAVLALLLVAVAFTSKEELFSVVNSGAGPVGAFGQAYGSVAKVIFGGFAAPFAVMILNAFILTTLDTATRIGRYLTQELFGVRSKFIATVAVVALAGWLGLSGEWNEIWPVFGAANQLIAALALIVISSWLLSRGKTARYTIVPMAFMLITTVAALIVKIIEYSRARNFVLLPVSIVLVLLAIFICVEAFITIRRNESYYRTEIWRQQRCEY
jgi:carbon starvation protein